MPIYEYCCTDCGKEFEEVVLGEATVACPHCGSTKVTKLLSCSHFRTGGPIVTGSPSANAITTRGKSGCASCSGGSCSTCH